MLQVFNTLTRTKEDFIPFNPQRVTFYHCGPTLYWHQHIGNLRSVVMADIVTRSLEYFGYRVVMVRNYTDVGHLTGDNIGDADVGEDRMEKGARREGLTPKQIADKYQTAYDRDVAQLNVRIPDFRPRATEHIQDIVDMVQTLLDKGFAYQTDLAVYFDVSKARQYTALSRQKLELNLAEAGKGSVSDPQKRHPADFALWFFKVGVHEKALQTWKSPFHSSLIDDGEGFPGWHIECSAMAKHYLGETLDIHMGGVEHIPIHHTNEIAQSESANGKPFVRYWLHNEHLLVNNGKMAKSDGTGYLLDDLIEHTYSPMELRYFFLTAHYRSKQNFTWEALDGAQNALNKLYDAVRQCMSVESREPLSGSQPQPQDESIERTQQNEYERRFQEALEDDLNTPQALAVVWDFIKSDVSSSAKVSSLLKFDRVLGLGFDRISPLNIPEHVAALIRERDEARGNKDFELSDNLRKKIENAGYLVEDTLTGQRIKKK